MNTQQLIQTLRNYCLENGNKETLQKCQRFFKEPYVGYGLTQPQIQAKVKELLKTNTISVATIIQAAPEILKGGMYEEISMILLLLDGKPKEFTREVFKTIESWFTLGITNWAHADTLGMFMMPKFLLKNVVELRDFKVWLSSPYKFQRRTVPVSLIKILKNNRSADFTSYFKFIEPLMSDPEREVHQGVGWFLREAWKIQPEVTEMFLLKWKDKTARLVIQYATEKMDKEYKARFKRSV